MRINTNIAALNSYNQLKNTQNNLSKSLERLSSGKRINGAADDAAGLAISEKMNSQIRGLGQAQRNAQDGISMIQTAEGALKESHSILQRMRELAVQSSNDTNTNEDRAEIQKEVDQLAKELSRISNNTEFNKQTLLNGAIQENNLGEATFHIGSNEGQNLGISIKAMDANTLGVADTGIAADVQTGAVDVNSASLDDTGLGSEIIDGKTVTLSTNDVASTATTGAVGGLTATTSGNTSELNGMTVAYADGGDGTTVSTSYDSDSNTITVTGDFNDGDKTASYSSSANITTAINNELSNQGFSATVSVTGSASTATAATSGSFTGGLAADEVELTLNGSSSETLVVKDDATSASFKSTEFSGLNLSLDGTLDTNTAATIDISEIASSGATFANGEKTGDAVAAAGIDVSNQENADEAIGTIDDAIAKVSAERSKLGAYQNRLDHTINNLNTAQENLTAAESRISDVDMAKEMMSFTKSQVLSQAGTAMMAQANQLPQGVLQLLG